jgi:plastocyanin
MTPKAMLAAFLLCAVALAGCTGGGGDGGNGTSTSGTGGAGAGGCVTGPGGQVVCGNATATGSATATSTSATNTTTGGGNATMQRTVRIENGAFSPAEITVPVGATVTWEHHDGNTAHTVTADDGSFDSSPNCSTPLPVGDCMTQGDRFTHTFTTAGDHPYHDKLDESLTGVVRVTGP